MSGTHPRVLANLIADISHAAVGKDMKIIRAQLVFLSQRV